MEEAACQQRYNYHLWMALSRMCVSLSTTLRSTDKCDNSQTIDCCNERYFKEASVDIVKKAVVLMKPHFKLRHFGKENDHDSFHGVDGVSAVVTTATGEDMLWIVDVLGKAVSNDGHQECIIKLAHSQAFHHFLIILSCASCLWARYHGYMLLNVMYCNYACNYVSIISSTSIIAEKGGD